MKYLGILPAFLLLLGCGIKPSPPSKKVDIEFVKQELASKNGLITGSTVKLPDSIWTVPLKDTSMYLVQSYFGSGDGYTIQLIKMKPGAYEILDSIYCFWADDLFTPENIAYSAQLNWFYYVDEGSGTNHYSETKKFIRVEGDHFSSILSFPSYVSDINPETDPQEYTFIEVKELEISETKIVLKAVFESGVVVSDVSTPYTIKEDVAVFEYSPEKKKFIWKSSTNADFKDFWLELKPYESI